MKDKKVVFMGTPEFAVPILKMLCQETNVILVVTQPDKAVGRHKEIVLSPIKKVALNNNIEVFQPVKIKEDYQKIIDINPDIIITCAYGQIVPRVLLECPKYKAINVHASILPYLRGGAPIHKAIIDGYKETGITIMYMDDEMDEGNIISQKSIAIEDEDNMGTLSDKLSSIGTTLLKETLACIFNNTNTSTKQNDKLATYAYTIKREEEKIDFTKTTKEVYNHIRGLYPFPVSYMIFNNEEIKVLKSYINNEMVIENTKCGQIINVYKNGIGIKCKDGEIVITMLKPFGKKEMNASDFINGKGKNNLIGRMVNE